jgi:hypothetical protein
VAAAAVVATAVDAAAVAAVTAAVAAGAAATNIARLRIDSNTEVGISQARQR